MCGLEGQRSGKRSQGVEQVLKAHIVVFLSVSELSTE